MKAIFYSKFNNYLFKYGKTIAILIYLISFIAVVFFMNELNNTPSLIEGQTHSLINADTILFYELTLFIGLLISMVNGTFLMFESTTVSLTGRNNKQIKIGNNILYSYLQSGRKLVFYYLEHFLTTIILFIPFIIGVLLNYFLCYGKINILTLCEALALMIVFSYFLINLVVFLNFFVNKFMAFFYSGMVIAFFIENIPNLFHINPLEKKYLIIFAVFCIIFGSIFQLIIMKINERKYKINLN
ncbi:MAG: hypothetical protein LBF82_00575 [Lactobacillales bacterium]|jgi:hypothetical protein|nr:hypothetical protein [Lactobacillales bacterium]